MVDIKTRFLPQLSPDCTCRFGMLVCRRWFHKQPKIHQRLLPGCEYNSGRVPARENNHFSQQKNTKNARCSRLAEDCCFVFNCCSYSSRPKGSLNSSTIFLLAKTNGSTVDFRWSHLGHNSFFSVSTVLTVSLHEGPAIVCWKVQNSFSLTLSSEWGNRKV